MQRGITLEKKLRYLKEVDNIHALSKKVRPPAGKSWSDIAASSKAPIKVSFGLEFTFFSNVVDLKPPT